MIYERPRQSVANLIGRFEHQTKRPSASSPSPRSSSVISHTTGDSTKEEIKEKREWPPRTFNETPQNGGDAAREEAKEKREWPPRTAGVFTLPTTDSVRDRPWQMKKPVDETSLSSGSKSPPRPSPLSREPSQSISLVQDLSAQEEVVDLVDDSSSKLQSAVDAQFTGTAAAKASAVQSTPATKVHVKSSMKTPVKPLPSSFSKSSSLHPVKPEASDRRTASAAASFPAPGRSEPPSRASTQRAKTPTATPSRSKTPSTKSRPPAIPKSPAPPARSRTPSNAIARSLSTGLYAPTAASLAKARNAQPPPQPQPERKKTLSSSISLDRLSKPTAASLSKARAPVAVSGPPPRKSAVPAKPRASAPTRMKPGMPKTAVVLAGSAGAVSAIVLETQQSAEPEHHENGHTSDGHDHEMLSDSATHPEITLSDVEGHNHDEDEILAHERGSQNVAEEPGDVKGAELIEDPIDAHLATLEHEGGELEERSAHAEVVIISPTESVDPASELHHADDEEEVITHAEPTKELTHDIEDMVNLLETGSLSSKIALDEPACAEPADEAEETLGPEVIAILDLAEEIPDEE